MKKQQMLELCLLDPTQFYQKSPGTSRTLWFFCNDSIRSLLAAASCAHTKRPSVNAQLLFDTERLAITAHR